MPRNTGINHLPRDDADLRSHPGGGDCYRNCVIISLLRMQCIMKRRFLPALVLVAVLLAFLGGCRLLEKDIRPEAFAVLEQMHRTGAQRVDAEIARLDQLLRDVEDRTVKLEQLVPQTAKWLEEKKAADYSEMPCG